MPDKLSFGKTFYALEKAISIAQQRNAVITSNISNLDTPGYKSKDINFKSELARALETNHKTDLAEDRSETHQHADERRSNDRAL